MTGACVGAALVTMGSAITREAFEGQLRLWNATRLVATVEAPPPGGNVPVPSRPCDLGNIDFKPAKQSDYHGSRACVLRGSCEQSVALAVQLLWLRGEGGGEVP